MRQINQKALEIELQKLARPESYSNYLEQYPTDAHNASMVLNLCFIDGNIMGKRVADLGSGNGVFSVGSAILGASTVYAVEVDEGQFPALRENSAGKNIILEKCDVSEFSENVDTVIMNPPFGSVRKGADRPFMEKAVEISGVVYSIHNRKSVEYVKEFYSRNGEIFRMIDMVITTPKLFAHHTKDVGKIEATLFCVNVA